MQSNTKNNEVIEFWSEKVQECSAFMPHVEGASALSEISIESSRILKVETLAANTAAKDLLGFAKNRLNKFS